MRKKVYTLLSLLFTLLLLANPALADIDLASMTDEQLISLNGTLIAELLMRGKSAEVPIGKYVVGQHIPAGEYTLKSISTSYIGSGFVTYTPGDEYGEHRTDIMLETGAIAGRVVLYDNDVVEVDYGPIKFTRLTAVTFTFE